MVIVSTEFWFRHTHDFQKFTRSNKRFGDSLRWKLPRTVLKPYRRGGTQELLLAEGLDGQIEPVVNENASKDWLVHIARRKVQPGPLPRSLEALIGLPALLEGGGRLVGIVAEVVKAGEGQVAPHLLRVTNTDVDPVYGKGAKEEHFIPLVPQIVLGVDWSLRAVVLRPPKGLLGLGRQRLLISYLGPLLLEIAGQRKTHEGEELRMPTRRDLEEAGRPDLVAMVVRAGGFPAVANTLGLRSRRRPVGYWENLDNLDQELTEFISQAWRRYENEEGIPYFYNHVSGQVAWDRSSEPTRMELDDQGSYLLVEDEWDRVMPTVSAVKAARRYDLHHAIDLHGGYRAVAEELGRTRCWPRYPHLREDPGALRQVLKEVALRQGIKQGAIPTKRAFLEAGRTDLYQIVQAEGGMHALARKLRFKTHRKEKGHWADFSRTLEEFQHYLTEKGHDSDYLPSQAQLVRDGRHDLRFALQTHTSEAVGAALGLKVSPRGRRRVPSGVQNHTALSSSQPKKSPTAVHDEGGALTSDAAKHLPSSTGDTSAGKQSKLH
eukprot:jgi/Botrbrau1/3097/Bobra.0070s0082.2